MAKKTSRGATRIPVRKERQPIAWQHWIRNGLLLSVVAGLIAVTVHLKQENILPILHVTVEGEFVHIDKDDLVKTVTPYATGGFMNVDVARLREAGESLPWVKVVQVKRIWPDSLHLVVEEQVAVANWGSDALVNAQGELFFPEKESFPEGLVQLKGPKKSSYEVAKRFYDISKLASTLGLRVKQVEMNERHAWTITFSNGLNLMLGRIDNEQRLQRFVSVFKSVLQPYQNEIKTVDMRYTNGMSVAWANGQQPDFNGTI